MNGPIRFSHLRAYGRSGAHGKHARAGGSDETAAMEKGTAVHALIFGNRKVIGYPGTVRRGKEFDAFAAEHVDAEILTMTAYDESRRIADAVLSSELAAPLLKGVVEQTIRFTWMGEQCRSTPDVRGSTFLTELKTTQSADPERFFWHSLRYHYHAQMRMQQIACMAKLDCYVVAIESSAPYPVTVLRFTDRALEQGEKLLMLWMERLRNCEQSRHWSPYVDSIVDLDVPEDEPELVFTGE
jgi:hypothetical protein